MCAELRLAWHAVTPRLRLDWRAMFAPLQRRILRRLRSKPPRARDPTAARPAAWVRLPRALRCRPRVASRQLPLPPPPASCRAAKAAHHLPASRSCLTAVFDSEVEFLEHQGQSAHTNTCRRVLAAYTGAHLPWAPRLPCRAVLGLQAARAELLPLLCGLRLSHGFICGRPSCRLLLQATRWCMPTTSGRSSRWRAGGPRWRWTRRSARARWAPPSRWRNSAAYSAQKHSVSMHAAGTHHARRRRRAGPARAAPDLPRLPAARPLPRARSSAAWSAGASCPWTSSSTTWSAPATTTRWRRACARCCRARRSSRAARSRAAPSGSEWRGPSDAMSPCACSTL